MKTSLLLWLGIFISIRADAEPQATSQPLSYEFTIRTKQAHLSIHRDFSLRILVGDSGIAPQIIDFKGTDISIIDDASVIDFQSFDYDNDGFKDFSIRDSTSATPNEIRHYFFWNTEKGQFEARNDVKGSFDPESRTFIDYWRMGPNSKSWSEWKFVGRNFLCLKSVSIGSGSAFRDIVPNADEEEIYRITTVFRQDGSARTFYKREKQ